MSTQVTNFCPKRIENLEEAVKTNEKTVGLLRRKVSADELCGDFGSPRGEAPAGQRFGQIIDDATRQFFLVLSDRENRIGK